MTLAIVTVAFTCLLNNCSLLTYVSLPTRPAFLKKRMEACCTDLYSQVHPGSQACAAADDWGEPSQPRTCHAAGKENQSPQPTLPRASEGGTATLSHLANSCKHPAAVHCLHPSGSVRSNVKPVRPLYSQPHEVNDSSLTAWTTELAQLTTKRGRKCL